MMKKLLIGLLTTGPLVSCSEKETPSNEVIVHATTELELKVNRKGQGWSIHNFSWDRYNVNESYWIYVNQIDRRVEGKDVSISFYRNLVTPNKDTKGYINFSSGTITINIQEPVYKEKNKVDHWEPFKFNGTYKLKYRGDSIK